MKVSFYSSIASSILVILVALIVVTDQYASNGNSIDFDSLTSQINTSCRGTVCIFQTYSIKLGIHLYDFSLDIYDFSLDSSLDNSY